MASYNHQRQAVSVERMTPAGDGRVEIRLRTARGDIYEATANARDLHSTTGTPLLAGDRVWVNGGLGLPTSIFFGGRTIWRNPAVSGY